MFFHFQIYIATVLAKSASAYLWFFRCSKILGEAGKQEILQQNVPKILDLKSSSELIYEFLEIALQPSKQSQGQHICDYHWFVSMEVLASVHASLLFFCFCYTVYPCSEWFFFTRWRWHSICQCLLMGHFLVRYSRPFLPFFLFCLFVFVFFFLQSFVWFCFSAVLMSFYCALLSYNICSIPI